ncbi:hypothetical protein EJD97_021943 [Solanum chilense]|uniref:Uncharacterized protein n=1 Tax=Solanum chilense TaxID=4083 RepID=A0A6N2C6X2_SOLCI|nr:hypothetical protein EJD97_021943 [Solanum chilense]
MDKGKNILMELTGEELQMKIEQVARKIQEAKEEGLRVDMATAIYKAANVTLDEDLASQMKRKKDVEMETEDLREKLDMLRLKVQEREARDARIESETTALERMAALRKKNKTFHRNMIDKLWKMGEKYPVYEQGANTGPDNACPEANEEDQVEEIIYKAPFLGLLKGGD